METDTNPNTDPLTPFVDGAIRLLEETVYKNQYIPKMPDSEGRPMFPSAKQQFFLALPHREILLGGARRGGKSVAMLAAALQYVECPGYSACIIRRSLDELKKPDGLIFQSHEWLRGTDAKYNGSTHQWRFPSGATLQFIHIASDLEASAVKGTGYQFIGFEELTEFTEYQYTYPFGSLQKMAGSTIPLRVRATTNPGGPGHEWVMRRFNTSDDPSIPPNEDRVFIKALYTDNPGIDHAEMEKSLDQLDPLTRAWHKYGDWLAQASGNLFQREHIRLIHEVPRHNITQKVRSWDLAGTPVSSLTPDPDWSAGVLILRRADDTFIIADMECGRVSPADVETMVRCTAELDGGDTDIVIQQDPGSAGKSLIDHYTRNVVPNYYVVPYRPTGDKVTRAKPLSAAMATGKILFVDTPKIRKLIDQMMMFPSSAAHDDFVDAASVAYNSMLEPPVIGPFFRPAVPTKYRF